MLNFSQILKLYHEGRPLQPAIIMQHSGQPDRTLTYTDLLLGATGYAEALDRHEIIPGEVVILILQHGTDLIFSFFGAVLHGVVPSIMPFLTEKLLPERYRADLAALVEITKPAAIITYPEFESEVRAALKDGSSVRAIIVSNTVQPAATLDWSKMIGLHREMRDTVLLQHSSGTTGLQKGVALSHEAVYNQLQSYSQALKLTPKDVIASWLPLYHDMGLIAGFLLPILRAVPLVLMSPFDWVRAPHRLLHAVTQYKATLTWLPNFAYNFMAQKVRERDLEGVDLSSWRAVINCSEPMRYDSHKLFWERYAPYKLHPGALATCYAMAENVFAVTQGGIRTAVTVDQVDRESMQVERIARRATRGQPVVQMLSAGKPIPGTEVKIVDEQGNAVLHRVIGEVAVRSNCMLSEYYHRPDATEKAFRDGWYLTGDFGYIAAGELYVTGRKKDLIIVGGKNIYPQDLELLAMEAPGVHAGRVSAFGVFNDAAGTEEVVIVAEVDATDPDEQQQIGDRIRQAVTRGSAVALRNVYIVNPPWIVKTSSGKTARSANRDKYLAEIAET